MNDGGGGGGGVDKLYAEAMSVWWDIENCQVPRGSDPNLIAQNISTALARAGFTGPISISAYGDTNQCSPAVQHGLSSTGISLHHVPAGIKDASDKKILVDMLFWAIDNPPPANYLLISGDRDFCNALHKLSMRRYNILLAHAPNVSQLLVAAARTVWHWKNLVAGEPPLSKPSYISNVKESKKDLDKAVSAPASEIVHAAELAQTELHLSSVSLTSQKSGVTETKKKKGRKKRSGVAVNLTADSRHKGKNLLRTTSQSSDSSSGNSTKDGNVSESKEDLDKALSAPASEIVHAAELAQSELHLSSVSLTSQKSGVAETKKKKGRKKKSGVAVNLKADSRHKGKNLLRTTSQISDPSSGNSTKDGNVRESKEDLDKALSAPASEIVHAAELAQSELHLNSVSLTSQKGGVAETKKKKKRRKKKSGVAVNLKAESKHKGNNVSRTTSQSSDLSSGNSTKDSNGNGNVSCKVNGTESLGITSNSEAQENVDMNSKGVLHKSIKRGMGGKGEVRKGRER